MVRVLRRKGDRGGRRRAGGARVPRVDLTDPAVAGDATGAAVDEVAALDGPYDVAEAPRDSLPRIDVGPLRIPVFEGLQLSFNQDEGSGLLLSAVVADGRGALELSVFAAPKSRGIWDEVRDEIVESLRSDGGTPQVVDGPYGREIRVYLPTAVPGQAVPGRLFGIDGPRWFLRGVLTGEPALDPAAGGALTAVLGGTVVVRGDNAMPLRDPLPLTLPRELQEAADQARQTDADAMGPPGPGVHITETR